MTVLGRNERTQINESGCDIKEGVTGNKRGKLDDLRGTFGELPDLKLFCELLQPNDQDTNDRATIKR